MTWLGKLLNLSLAALLVRQGIAAKARAFCIAVEPTDPATILALIRSAVLASTATNPISEQPVEKAADLGSHWRSLSPSGQKLARGDFYDAGYLRDWVSNLTECRLENVTPLAESLLWLAGK
jgi:hypothetical protein